ncbi:MAG: OmpH family outer membrane protein [Gemmatimonadales bacterium]
MARWAIAASIVLVVVGMGARQGSLPIGFVNSDIVLQQTPGYPAADSTLQADLKSFQDEVTSLRQRMDSATKAFDQQRAVLSPADRDAKVKELQEMGQRFQQRTDELQGRAQERQRELIAPLESRIQTVIDGVRAERNLAMIFDIAAARGAIISADPTLDLTSLVVSRLRSAGGGDR